MQSRLIASLLAASFVASHSWSAVAEDPSESCNRIGCDVYRTLAVDSDGDVVIAPVSLCTQLAMLRLGAERLTAEELDLLWSPDVVDTDFSDDMSRLMTSLASSIPEEQWQSINRMWIDESLDPRRAFETELSEMFGSEVIPLNFRRAPAARRVANLWGRRVSRNRIDDLIPRGWLERDTCFVLANIMLLDAEWKHPFDPSSTHNARFHLSERRQRTVKMMKQKRQFRYAEVDGAHIVELPYKEDSLSMVLVVPLEIEGLKEIESDLSGETVETWFRALAKPEIAEKARGGLASIPPLVTLWLPRFAGHSDVDLAAPLESLGLQTLFSREPSTLPLISDDPRLYLQGMLQSTWIAVDEQGTRAASATRGKGGFGGGPMMVEVRADRPFLYLVRHGQSNTILLIGRMTG